MAPPSTATQVHCKTFLLSQSSSQVFSTHNFCQNQPIIQATSQPTKFSTTQITNKSSRPFRQPSKATIKGDDKCKSDQPSKNHNKLTNCQESVSQNFFKIAVNLRFRKCTILCIVGARKFLWVRSFQNGTP